MGNIKAKPKMATKVKGKRQLSIYIPNELYELFEVDRQNFIRNKSDHITAILTERYKGKIEVITAVNEKVNALGR